MSFVSKVHSTKSFSGKTRAIKYYSFSNTETMDWANAVKVQDPNNPTQVPIAIALDTFISTLKTNGLWSRFEFLWFSAAPSLRGALVPIKTTYSGLMSNNGYLDNEYTPTYGILRYIISTSKDINTNKSVVGGSLTNVNIANVNHSNYFDYNFTGYLYGAQTSSNPLYIAGGSTTLTVRSPAILSATVVLGEGFLMTNRTSGNTSTINQNGVQLASVTTAASLTLTDPIRLTARTLDGVVNTDNTPIALDMYGHSTFLSLADSEIIRTALSNFRTAQFNYLMNL